jgi:drug/metabolite transporter (DMT)-like permease
MQSRIIRAATLAAAMLTSANFRPVAALITGAAIWGVIWYPYRALMAMGIGGIAASVLTYIVALLLGLLVLRRHLRAMRWSPMLAAIALTAGGCNIGYVVATLHGEVMRVLLLFYLAPLWTVLLAFLLLGERLTRVGGAVVVLSLAGAMIMLWHPQLGAPWPRAGAEWAGMAAGLLFALSNVLIRKAKDLTIEIKSLAVFVGAIVIGGGLLAAGVEAAPVMPGGEGWLILGIVGLVLLLVNLVVQFGLMGIPANRAIVILLSELVFAALFSWLLAGETMGLREWIGGGLIAAASVLSARMESSPH